MLITNEDNMELMARYEDNYFDLAIVDPPYGISINKQSQGKGGGVAKKIDYTKKDWDSEAPNKNYFIELFRVSKNVIIWGANHFIENIPNANSSSWIVWDKENGANDFADCELAYSSFKTAVRRFTFRWHGMLQGDMRNKEKRIHPTQKPEMLLELIILASSNEGDIVLDPFFGTGTTGIVAKRLNREWIGIEMDKNYVKLAENRIKNDESKDN